MITGAMLRSVPLLAGVPDAELDTIAKRAADLTLHTNEWLIQEGELPAFFMLLSGRLTVYKSVAGVERAITEYAPGDYGGELPLLLGSPAIASIRASEPSRVCRLDAADFRQLIVACPELNARLLRTMATRIEGLQQLATEAPLATVRSTRCSSFPTERAWSRLRFARSPRASVCRPRHRGALTTLRSSAPGRPVWPPPCTALPRGSPLS